MCHLNSQGELKIDSNEIINDDYVTIHSARDAIQDTDLTKRFIDYLFLQYELRQSKNEKLSFYYFSNAARFYVKEN